MYAFLGFVFFSFAVLVLICCGLFLLTAFAFLVGMELVPKTTERVANTIFKKFDSFWKNVDSTLLGKIDDL